MQTDKEKQITVQEDIINCEKELDETRRAAKRLKFEVKQAESNLRDVKEEEINNTKKTNILQRRLQSLRLETQKLEQQIQAQMIEDRVEELFSQQPDFWKTVNEQVKSIQEQTNVFVAGFGEQLAPEKITERLQSAVNGEANFSPVAVEIRRYRDAYNKSLKEMCRKKIEGALLSKYDIERPRFLIDELLYKPSIEGIWNAQ